MKVYIAKVKRNEETPTRHVLQVDRFTRWNFHDCSQSVPYQDGMVRRGAYLTELHVGVVRRLSEGISEALGGTMLYLISAMFGAHLSFYSSRSSLRSRRSNLSWGSNVMEFVCESTSYLMPVVGPSQLNKLDVR